ncbi:MAG: hypothetical protein ACR2P2_05555, partial [Nakamurella sp.]
GHNGFSRVLRTALVGAGYVGSFAVEPDKKPAHYTLVSFDKSDDVPDQVRKYGNMALGTASWIGIQAVLAHLAALVPLPKAIKAMLLGGGVAVADSWIAERARSGAANRSA